MGHGIHESEYQRMYSAHYRMVLAYCVRRVGRDDGEDLANEVFTVAWRRGDVIPATEDALPWLYGVAYRVVSHFWRGQARRGRLNTKLGALPASSPLGPENQLVQRQEYDLVIKAASRLRSLDQEVLRLALWEELSHSQIAELLSSTVPAVRQRFHRAKRSLLREFERVGGVLPPPSVAHEGGEL